MCSSARRRIATPGGEASELGGGSGAGSADGDGGGGGGGEQPRRDQLDGRQAHTQAAYWHVALALERRLV
jgi:hypothetical protein